MASQCDTSEQFDCCESDRRLSQPGVSKPCVAATYGHNCDVRVHVDCFQIHKYYFVFLLWRNNGGTVTCCEDVFFLPTSNPSHLFLVFLYTVFYVVHLTGFSVEFVVFA